MPFEVRSGLMKTVVDVSMTVSQWGQHIEHKSTDVSGHVPDVKTSDDSLRQLRRPDCRWRVCG